MKDRDIAIGYQNVKDGSAYEAYDKAYSELEKQDFGKVLCLNDNFGLNSLIKKYHDCSQYDMVVLNGTHQRYCFNVFPELLVDSFYTDVPDLDGYDTVLVDYANIDTKEFEKLVGSCNHNQRVVCFNDGVEIKYNGGRAEKYHIGVDHGSPEGDKTVYTGDFYEDEVVSEREVEVIDGDETEFIPDEFISEEESQELREKLVDDEDEVNGAD